MLKIWIKKDEEVSLVDSDTGTEIVVSSYRDNVRNQGMIAIDAPAHVRIVRRKKNATDKDAAHDPRETEGT